MPVKATPSSVKRADESVAVMKDAANGVVLESHWKWMIEIVTAALMTNGEAGVVETDLFV